MHTSHLNPDHSARNHNLLVALMLASLAAAGLILPFVWDGLATLNEMPKILWLQNALAQAPIASWLMMFVWGAAVPAILLLGMHQAPAHKLRCTLTTLAVMMIALTWYVHMPMSGQCMVMYPRADWACTLLRWGYSLSLGLATAAYVFTMLAMGFSALGLLAENLDEPTAHA